MIDVLFKACIVTIAIMAFVMYLGVNG